MFKSVDSRVSFPKMEERILEFWKQHDTFKRSVQAREGGPTFIMYEGPPTANGMPGIHHVLARVFKDIMPRYKAMQGYHTPRIGGWDTHGLPVELEVEKQLGISSKREIEAYGIEAFNQKCRESVYRYVHEWERMTGRIGFWVDMDNAYATLKNDYIETGWWILKKLWDKGLVYNGYKTTPHCPRCGTSLSSHEVALGYREDTVDPSVFVKFRLVDRDDGGNAVPAVPTPLHRVLFDEGVPSYAVAWTTTPWTLPGNTALAVAPEAQYVVVERTISSAAPEAAETSGSALQSGDTPPALERLVIAKALVASALKGDDYTVLAEIDGTGLVNLLYQPLFSPPEMGFTMRKFTPVQEGGAKFLDLKTLEPYHHTVGEPLTYRIVSADFVSMDDGTGIVHIAPAFGEDDFALGETHNLHFVQHVDLKGEIEPNRAGLPFSGKFVKDADPLITRNLRERGLLLRAETMKHTYPFCWRCGTPLLYYVKPSWYLRTTALKQNLVDGNAQIHWYPSHIREGRFGNWLENNIDWAISRERYWGTPIPIWRCQSCGAADCVGGLADLKAKPGIQGLKDDLDLHRPFVDDVMFSCSCGGTMKRILEVMDCWFDSGAMPYAQWHYPFENQATFKQWFPADYICEAVDQTRGWFYTLHALATMLHAADPELIPSNISYEHVICLGLILDGKGEKMSKSKGNVVNPWQVLDQHGADAIRWYLYTASPAGQQRRFSADLVGESLRKFLLTLWNTYSFFVTYANIDDYTPPPAPGAGLPGGVMPVTSSLPRGELSDLDRWVRSELHELVEEVGIALEAYDPTEAGRKIQAFVDDLSNWYVRRSRRRFWKSGVLSESKGENDGDKLAAYDTLYECLVTVTKLLAPFTPFVAEELYQNLVLSVDPAAPHSVHMADYPEADAAVIDSDLNRDVRAVMRAVSLGRAARSKAGVKVRQPLASVTLRMRSAGEAEGVRRFADQVAEELNVKAVEVTDDISEYATVRIKYNAKVHGSVFGRELPAVLHALEHADTAAILLSLQAGEDPKVADWTIPREALNVEYTAKGSWVVANDGTYVAVVDKRVTPELAQEGLARELVHRIQTMRKTAGFDIADSIETYYQGDAEVAAVLTAHATYMAQETLSRSITAGVGPEGAYAEDLEVEGHPVRISVRKTP
ncbi:MAG: isoleucine--tRNA ligase [Dehalococcoidia bacterium]|nr:isoleucine--tRNA ligase [Dehalococcoidia bacterium]